MENQLIEDLKIKIINKGFSQKNNVSNNITNGKISLNQLKYIYDEEFISSLNSLSTSIKNYFQNNKLYLGNIKIISDNINEQTLFSKSVINDILLYFNQITKTRYINMNISSNINEKYIKDKIKLVNERIEKINELKINMQQNIKSCELSFLSFYEVAKNLFKKMKIIRTEKIENLNKKIIVNKSINNNAFTYNNISFHKQDRTISHSPCHKAHIMNNIINNRSKLIQKNNANKNNIISTKIVTAIKTNNNNYNNNEDLNEAKNIKKRYIELLQENKKLKEDLSKMSKANNSRQKKKVNTICSSTPLKEISSFVKRCTTATKKKYIQKPLSIGNIHNTIKNLNKSNSHSRIQTQTHVKNILNDLNEEESNNNKLIRNISKKSELIPIGSFLSGIDKENNILSISRNSMDIIGGTGGIEGSFKNNSSNNILASMVLSFLKEMKKLQENITKKVDNIKELKKNFELKKRELKIFSEKIVDNNLSSTYTGKQLNTFTNIIVDNNFKIKSKEQSLKASMDSFNKDSINNINNDFIKEFETKNKEQNKEKDIEKLSKEIIEKAKIIENLENDLKLKEEKIKKEKEISSLREEKLNAEKMENKNMSEEIINLKNKIEKNEKELKDAIDKIINLETINKKLKEIQTQQKILIEEMKTNSKKESNKYNQLKKEIEVYKLNDNEIISLKNENMKLKQQIAQCNNNLVTISNTNESIIHEKDKIIKNLQNNIKELSKQIDLLNNEIYKHGNNLSHSTILKDEINNLRKNNDDNQQKILKLQTENRQLKNRMAEIKTNYVSHDEDFNNIKKILSELNAKTEHNLKKNQENEKKFEICSKVNDEKEKMLKYSKEMAGDNNKITQKSITEIEKKIDEYKLILGEIKKISNTFSKVNKEFIDDI